MKSLSVVGVVLFGLTGCVTIQTAPPVPVNDDRFDGLWKGAAVIPTNPVDGSLCTGDDIPVYFRVKDRVAKSMMDHPKRSFITQVGSSGEIKFAYKEAATSDASVGVSLPVDIDFWGGLGETYGSGRFKFGTLCPGEWTVTRMESSRRDRVRTESPTNAIESNYKKPYIIIQSNDVVEAGGKPKFKVKPGDILEIVHEKTCLNGFGICFKVRNPDTGEWGFVTEERMESRHDIVKKVSGVEKNSRAATRRYSSDAGRAPSSGGKVVFHSRYIEGFEVISRNCNITRRIHSPIVTKSNNLINMKWKVALAANNGCSEDKNISILQNKLDRELAAYEALLYINDSDQFDGYLSKSKIKKLSKTEKVKSLVEMAVSKNSTRTQSGRNVSGYNISGHEELMQLIEVEAIVHFDSLLDSM